MKPAVTILAALSLCVWCLAQTPPIVPDDVLARIQEEHPNPLPRYMTPDERDLPLPLPSRDAPPSGVIHCPAEYEPCQGLFISWQGYTTILTQLAVGVTVNDPTATVYVVVDSSSEQTSAYNTLSTAGAHMDQIQFIVRITDTVWIRDYGPRFIFDDGARAIIDHTYNRPRPNDDAFNDYLATLWNEPQYDIGLTHGGGNFHLFTNGDAFMSSLILAENPGLTEQQIKDRYRDYQNVSLTIYTGFPTSFDSTRHIDMWMFPVGDNKIIIGQYAPSTGQPYTITENAVADLTARGYTVYRTPGWSSGGTHFTYTNAVVLNNQVFISKFNVAQDAQALAVFQEAMPGYLIHQIDCTSIIGAAGALHCIVMHVPAYPTSPVPTARVDVPNGGETWNIGQTYDIRWVARDDVAVTSVDLALSTDSGATFPYTIAAGLSNSGLYTWTAQARPSTHCRVRVVAHDADGNSGEDISNADFTISYPAQVVYDFSFATNPGWTTEGQWAFGQPSGGGTHNRDPNSGHTGTNVYGYNLAGDYTSNMAKYTLTTTALNLRHMAATELRFWRRLGVERFDRATLEVSNDGATWSTLWTNPTDLAVADTTWVQQVFSLATVADGQPTVYVRWGIGPTDGSTTYPGWNIDDVQIVGTPIVTPGDLNCDGEVNFADINPFVLALGGYDGYHAAFPDCLWLNSDCNGDGVVAFGDINPFVALLTAP